MLRAPIWITSATSATSSSWRGSSSSVTIGSPVSSRASRRMASASTPSPWKAYGDVRGLNAPPRSIVAPAAATTRAVSSVCSRVSTVHGPAMSPNQPSPILRPRASITVGSGEISRETSLYGLRIGSTCSTPGYASSGSVVEQLALADGADHRRLAPARDARIDPHLLEPRDDVLRLLGGRAALHDDEQLG